jgi:hypothetical protein
MAATARPTRFGGVTRRIFVSDSMRPPALIVLCTQEVTGERGCPPRSAVLLMKTTLAPPSPSFSRGTVAQVKARGQPRGTARFARWREQAARQGYTFGFTFAFSRNRLVGSYLFFKATSRG